MSEALGLRSTLQGAAKRAAQRPTRRMEWALPPASATLVIFAGLMLIATLILLITWQFPILPPDTAPGTYTFPGVDALGTALALASVLWCVLALAEFVACCIPRIRIDWRRLLVLSAALTLGGLLIGLAMELRDFASL